ncbi:MAG: hypothetical protein OEZ06_23890 [Myxococcales bacterium]|nr:hypothetical protein [Myxococcales bacterium]
MNDRFKALIDDPGQPQLVRDLLQAGREAAPGYDFEQGFANHLGHIDAGTPMPDWAQGLQGSAGVGGAGAGAAGAATGAAGVGLGAWVAGGLVTAGAVAAVVWSALSPAAPSQQPVVVPQMPSPAVVASPAVPVAEALVPEAPEASAPQPSVVESAGVRSRQVAPSEAAPVRAAREVAASEQSPAAPSAPVQAFEPSAAQANQASQGGALDLDRLMGARVDDSKVVSKPRRPSPAARVAEEPVEHRAPSEAVAEDRPVATAAKPAAAPLYDDARLEREMRMLKVAQSVLKSNPLRALRLARQGEQEFPGSMFTQERQQVLLLALIELGKLDEAKRLARPYLKRYPKGPFSDQLRRALVTGSVQR